MMCQALRLFAKDIYLMIRSCAFLVFSLSVRFLDGAGLVSDDIKEFVSQKTGNFIEEFERSEQQWRKLVEIAEQKRRRTRRED